MPAPVPARRPPAPRSPRRARPALALGALALVVGSGTACIKTRRDPVTGRVAVDVRSPLQKGTVWDARLQGAGQFAPVNGSARVDVIDGRATLALRVTGLQPGATHPWRVHEGACGALGAQVGDAMLYAPLLVNTQGVAEGTAQLPPLDIARRYKVRLFVSPTDSTSEVVCGNLTYR